MQGRHCSEKINDKTKSLVVQDVGRAGQGGRGEPTTTIRTEINITVVMQEDSDKSAAHWCSCHTHSTLTRTAPQTFRVEGSQKAYWPGSSLVMVVGFLVEHPTNQGWDSTPWMGSLCRGLCFSSLATKSLAPALILVCAG